MSFSWLGLSVSDAELTEEFNFWKTRFLRSICVAVVCVAIGGFLIAVWPVDVGNQELRSFVKTLWPAFIEFAFWFGFLIGLLWAASRRIGCALACTVPWTKTKMPIGALFGQAACALVLGSCLLWVGTQFVRQLGADMAGVVAILMQLVNAGFILASACLLFSLGLRKSVREGSANGKVS